MKEGTDRTDHEIQLENTDDYIKARGILIKEAQSPNKRVQRELDEESKKTIASADND